MPTCSDRGIILKFSGKSASSKTFLSAADGAEVTGRRMREGKRYPCRHCKNAMTTRDECRQRFLGDDERCHIANTPCALGQLAASEAAA